MNYLVQLTAILPRKHRKKVNTVYKGSHIIQGLLTEEVGKIFDSKPGRKDLVPGPCAPRDMRRHLELNKRSTRLSSHSQSFIHKLFRRLKGPQYQAQVGAEFIIEIHGKVKAGDSHIWFLLFSENKNSHLNLTQTVSLTNS